MLAGFIVWSVVAVLLCGIGIWALKAKNAVGFFAGIKPPEVDDVKKYNHAVAKIWFVYAGIFELFGIPLLFLKQNPPLFVIPILGVVMASIGLAIAYTLIEAKHQKKQK
ncbi:MAG: hypothetical protein IK055_04230 [Lachnospiraceae bacterium]|nr:hypothetical protein [Lachnospiraceae bacterium]